MVSVLVVFASFAILVCTNAMSGLMGRQNGSGVSLSSEQMACVMTCVEQYLKENRVDPEECWKEAGG